MKPGIENVIGLACPVTVTSLFDFSLRTMIRLRHWYSSCQWYRCWWRYRYCHSLWVSEVLDGVERDAWGVLGYEAGRGRS